MLEGGFLIRQPIQASTWLIFFCNRAGENTLRRLRLSLLRLFSWVELEVILCCLQFSSTVSQFPKCRSSQSPSRPSTDKKKEEGEKKKKQCNCLPLPRKQNFAIHHSIPTWQRHFWENGLDVSLSIASRHTETGSGGPWPSNARPAHAFHLGSISEDACDTGGRIMASRKLGHANCCLQSASPPAMKLQLKSLSKTKQKTAALSLFFLNSHFPLYLLSS